MRDNAKLAWDAVSAIERGDAKELGRAMTAAQVCEWAGGTGGGGGGNTRENPASTEVCALIFWWERFLSCVCVYVCDGAVRRNRGDGTFCGILGAEFQSCIHR